LFDEHEANPESLSIGTVQVRVGEWKGVVPHCGDGEEKTPSTADIPRTNSGWNTSNSWRKP